MTSPHWRYGAVCHWRRSNVTMMERIDRTTGKIGAKLYVNDDDWRTKLNVDIPCVFESFDQLAGIGAAFSAACIALYGDEESS